MKLNEGGERRCVEQMSDAESGDLKQCDTFSVRQL